MNLRNHYQNAYVTNDLDKAMAIMRERYGVRDWITFEPDMKMRTAEGERQVHLRVALAWAGGLNLELIQNVDGWFGAYQPFLPADPTDPTPRFHHIAVRRENLEEMREEIASLGLPFAFEGSVPGLTFIYVDATQTLGHFLEFVWASPEGWEMNGWPKDRPVF